VGAKRNSGGSAAGAERRLARALRGLPRARHYLIAFSGGADSSALLHAICRGPDADVRRAAVSAVHVHHGLHPHADRWAAHCLAFCGTLGVALRVLRVDARPAPGESPEAAARRARYAALEPLIEREMVLCTAHHLDDQAETVLLHLLRGAGPRGLAAMPAQRAFGAGLLARPFLSVEGRILRAYVEGAGLNFVDDDSNRDPRLDRGYLRGAVLPALMHRWPGLAATLGRAAAHQAEAWEVIATLARADLANAVFADGGLSIASVTALPAARRHTLLRLWLRDQGLPTPSNVQLAQIERVMLDSRDDASPLVCWAGAEVRRFRGVVYATAPLAKHDPRVVLPWDPSRPLALGDGSRLLARPVKGAGLSVRCCARGALTVRFRRGGERCRPAGSGHRRALKKLLQEHAVPPWLRSRVPLLYCGDELAAVANLCVCEGYAAGADEPGWELCWQTVTAVPRRRGE